MNDLVYLVSVHHSYISLEALPKQRSLALGKSEGLLRSFDLCKMLGCSCRTLPAAYSDLARRILECEVLGRWPGGDDILRCLDIATQSRRVRTAT